MTCWAELSPSAQKVFEEALRHPALWAFSVLAAKLGVDAAAGVLGAPTQPVVAEALAAGSWTSRDLPDPSRVRALLLGADIVARLRTGKQASLRGVVRELGVAEPDAHAALRELERMGVKKLAVR